MFSAYVVKKALADGRWWFVLGLRSILFLNLRLFSKTRDLNCSDFGYVVDGSRDLKVDNV